MPGGDRRGPRGMGPRTGRGLGYCAGSDRPGYQTDAAPAAGGWGFHRAGGGRGFGQGFGYGRGYGHGAGFGHGFGRGLGWGFHRAYGAYDGPAYTAEEEVADLKTQIKILEDRIARINKD